MAESLNTQFYNIIAAIAKANDFLAQATVEAERYESNRLFALDKVNALQEEFDELVKLTKKDALDKTNWSRYG